MSKSSINIKNNLKILKRTIKKYIKVEFFGSLDASMDEAINRFSESIEDENKIKSIRKDMRKCYIFSEFVPDEFFMFGFQRLDKAERKKYLSGVERKRRIFQLSTKESRSIFMDKYKTYEIYKAYYQREIVKIECNDEIENEKLNAFMDNHRRFIVKPTGGYQGAGVHIVDVDSGCEEIARDVMKCAPCVLEELIIQAPALSRFHPDSVNSIRIVSCVTQTDVEILFAILRMGVGGNVVDNVGAGGIVAALNVATGVVCSDGYRNNGKIYAAHPDTGVPIQGAQIPFWPELIQMTKELALIVPEQKVIGWDFALTEDGWSIIEANHSPSCKSIQMIQGGIKKRAEEIWEKS